MFDLNTLVFLGSVPLIIAFVQICKMWVSDGRLYPLLALLFGLIINIAVSWRLGLDMFNAIPAGLIAGFTACGIYSASVPAPPT